MYGKEMEIFMKKRLIALILALCVLFCAFPAFAEDVAEEAPKETLPGHLQYIYLSEVANFVSKNYKFGITRDQLMEEAFYRKLENPDITFNGMVGYMMKTMDEHTTYLTEDEYNALLHEHVDGEIVGIGVTITERSGRVVVISPIKDSPAFLAGILPGDIIVSVDKTDTQGMNIDGVRALVMGEAGTQVRIGVLRGEEVLYFDIVRDKVREITVSYEVLSDNIGYISITQFNKNVVEAVEEALDEFKKTRVTKIIFDLRYNPGGELTEVIELCRMFVTKGVIATIDYNDESGRDDETFFSYKPRADYKIAVLINEGSASGSELFAGAVQDSGVGKIIGTTSYGKGTVQEIIPMLTGGGIKLTVAEYKTKSGKAINKVGIQPDMYVTNTYKQADISHFKEIDFSRLDWNEKSSGDGVLAIEQRLEFLGYMENADTVFDKETKEALELFQAYAGLTATGVGDLNTLLYLSGYDYEVPVLVDRQLEAAQNYLQKLK